MICADLLVWDSIEGDEYASRLGDWAGFMTNVPYIVSGLSVACSGEETSGKGFPDWTTYQ